LTPDSAGEAFGDLALLGDVELAAAGLHLLVGVEGAKQHGQATQALQQGGPHIVLELEATVSRLPFGCVGHVL
jgi:hypothetical protein